MNLLSENPTSTVAGIALTLVERHDSADAALELLRGTAPSVRRVVWLHSDNAIGAEGTEDWAAQLGTGDLGLLATSGCDGRQLAMAARDAGLPMSKVVVCRAESMAATVVADETAPGDQVFMIGVGENAAAELVRRIAARWGAALATGPSY